MSIAESCSHSEALSATGGAELEDTRLTHNRLPTAQESLGEVAVQLAAINQLKDTFSQAPATVEPVLNETGQRVAEEGVIAEHIPVKPTKWDEAIFNICSEHLDDRTMESLLALLEDGSIEATAAIRKHIAVLLQEYATYRPASGIGRPAKIELNGLEWKMLSELAGYAPNTRKPPIALSKMLLRNNSTYRNMRGDIHVGLATAFNKLIYGAAQDGYYSRSPKLEQKATVNNQPTSQTSQFVQSKHAENDRTSEEQSKEKSPSIVDLTEPAKIKLKDALSVAAIANSLEGVTEKEVRAVIKMLKNNKKLSPTAGVNHKDPATGQVSRHFFGQPLALIIDELKAKL